jgi:hypothetical protein
MDGLPSCYERRGELLRESPRRRTTRAPRASADSFLSESTGGELPRGTTNLLPDVMRPRACPTIRMGRVCEEAIRIGSPSEEIRLRTREQSSRIRDAPAHRPTADPRSNRTFHSAGCASHPAVEGVDSSAIPRLHRPANSPESALQWDRRTCAKRTQPHADTSSRRARCGAPPEIRTPARCRRSAFHRHHHGHVKPALSR